MGNKPSHTSNAGNQDKHDQQSVHLSQDSQPPRATQETAASSEHSETSPQAAAAAAEGGNNNRTTATTTSISTTEQAKNRAGQVFSAAHTLSHSHGMRHSNTTQWKQQQQQQQEQTTDISSSGALATDADLVDRLVKMRLKEGGGVVCGSSESTASSSTSTTSSTGCSDQPAPPQQLYKQRKRVGTERLHKNTSSSSSSLSSSSKGVTPCSLTVPSFPISTSHSSHVVDDGRELHSASVIPRSDQRPDRLKFYDSSNSRVGELDEKTEDCFQRFERWLMMNGAR